MGKKSKSKHKHKIRSDKTPVPGKEKEATQEPVETSCAKPTEKPSSAEAPREQDKKDKAKDPSAIKPVNGQEKVTHAEVEGKTDPSKDTSSADANDAFFLRSFGKTDGPPHRKESHLGAQPPPIQQSVFLQGPQQNQTALHTEPSLTGLASNKSDRPKQPRNIAPRHELRTKDRSSKTLFVEQQPHSSDDETTQAADNYSDSFNAGNPRKGNQMASNAAAYESEKQPSGQNTKLGVVGPSTGRTDDKKSGKKPGKMSGQSNAYSSLSATQTPSVNSTGFHATTGSSSGNSTKTERNANQKAKEERSKPAWSWFTNIWNNWFSSPKNNSSFPSLIFKILDEAPSIATLLSQGTDLSDIDANCIRSVNAAVEAFDQYDRIDKVKTFTDDILFCLQMLNGHYLKLSSEQLCFPPLIFYVYLRFREYANYVYDNSRLLKSFHTVTESLWEAFSSILRSKPDTLLRCFRLINQTKCSYNFMDVMRRRSMTGQLFSSELGIAMLRLLCLSCSESEIELDVLTEVLIAFHREYTISNALIEINKFPKIYQHLSRKEPKICLTLFSKLSSVDNINQVREFFSKISFPEIDMNFIAAVGAILRSFLRKENQKFRAITAADAISWWDEMYQLVTEIEHLRIKSKDASLDRSEAMSHLYGPFTIFAYQSCLKLNRPESPNKGADIFNAVVHKILLSNINEFAPSSLSVFPESLLSLSEFQNNCLPSYIKENAHRHGFQDIAVMLEAISRTLSGTTQLSVHITGRMLESYFNSIRIGSLNCIRVITQVMSCSHLSSSFLIDSLEHQARITNLMSSLPLLDDKYSIQEGVVRNNRDLYAAETTFLYRSHSTLPALHLLITKALADLILQDATKSSNSSLQLIGNIKDILWERFSSNWANSSLKLQIYCGALDMAVGRLQQDSKILFQLPVMRQFVLNESQLELLTKYSGTKTKIYINQILFVQQQFSQFADLFNKKQINYATILTLQQNIQPFQDNCKLFKAELICTPEKLRMEFDELRENLQGVELVYSWLGGFDNRVFHIALTDPNEVTLRNLKDDIETFAASLNLHQEAFEALQYFLGKHCSLFEQIVSRNLIRDRAIEYNSKIISDSVITSVNLLKSLLEGRLTVSELNSLRKSMELGANFLKQINIVADYFQNCQRVTEQQYKSMQLNAIAATSLASYASNLIYLIRCLEVYEIFPDTQEEIQRLQTNLEHELQNIRISEASEKVKFVNKEVAYITADQLEYFEVAVKVKDLVDFLIRQSQAGQFEERTNILVGELQGDRYQQTLLTNLILSNQVLEPLIQVKSSTSQNTTFGTFCSSIKERYTQTEQLRKVVDAHGGLDQIKVWFSRSSSGVVTLDFILPFINRILRQGCFFSRLALNPKGEQLFLRYEEQQNEQRQISFSHLQDLIRGVSVFLNRDAIAEPGSLERVDHFEKVFEVAQSIHSVRCLLEASGHPAYQGLESAINSEGELSAMFLETLKEKLNLQLRQWSAAVEKIEHEDYKRLLFLNSHQLSKFAIKMLEIKTDSENYEYSSLYSFFWMCYPDHCNAHSAEEIEQAIEAGVNAVRQLQLDDIQTDERLLDLGQTFVNHLDKKMAGLDRQYVLGIAPEPPTVVLAYDYSPGDILKLLTSINDGPMHHARTFWCDERTSRNELDNFLKRLIAFSHLSYQLVHVNRLGIKEREHLLDWMTSYYLNKSFKELGSVTLIFTKQNGVEMFSFLKSAQYMADIDKIDIGEALAVQNRKKSMGLQVVETVCGPALCGKSTYIKKRIANAQVDHSVRFALNEDFSPRSFIAVLKYFNNSNSLGVHFDISAYAPYAAVSQFLFDLLVHGVVVDLLSGEMEKVILKSLIFYFEISRAPANDRTSGLLSQIEDILAALPILKVFSNIVTIDISNIQPFDINDDAKLCAAAFNAWYFNKSIGPKCAKSVAQDSATLTDDETRTQLDRIWDTLRIARTEKINMHKRTFVSLIAQRVRWLQEREEKLEITYACEPEGAGTSACNEQEAGELQKALKQQIMSPLLKWFEAFVQESTFLATDKISLSPQLPIVGAMSNGQIPSVVFFNFGNRNFALSASENELTLNKVLNKSSLLRIELANGLGLQQTAKMRQIVEQQNFVLTPDFAVKLLLLHQRRLLGLNVVFSGDTGIGKTELNNLYSVIANADSELVPNIIEDLHEFILQKLLLDDNYEPRSAEFIPLLAKSGANWVAAATEEHAPFPRTKAGVRHALQLIINTTDAANDGERLADDRGKVHFLENTTYWQFAAHKFVDFAHSYVNKYFLIKTKSHFFNKLTDPNCVQPVDIATHEQNNPDSQLVVRNVDELEQLFTEFLNATFSELFHRILMHQKIDAEQFRSKIHSIIKECESVIEQAVSRGQKREDVHIKFVVFIDEFNTTSIMGVLKEVLVDRSLNGQPLPEYLFFVAAMNPAETSAQRESSFVFDTTGISHLDSAVFAVRPPAESIKSLTLDFQNFDENQTRSFLNELSALQYDLGTEKERKHLVDLIKLGQQFIYSANIHRIHTSIRDILRCVNLYKYFRKEKSGRAILECSIHSSSLRKPSQFSPQYSSGNDPIHWCALVLSLAMGYYFRLDSKNRQLLGRQFTEYFSDHDCPAEYLIFEDTVWHVLEQFYAQVIVPQGIARTKSLMQNLFCTIVCIDAKVPLIIVGPPGTSKTLSFTIACENLKREQSASELFRQLHHMYPFRYQCSEQSTDVEIEATYRSAIDRQKAFEGDNPLQCTARSVVLLDEAGLPPEDRASLKVIHYFLDHPVVSSVILSNKTLDAAKMNRACQVMQDQTTLGDLISLAEGCLLSDAKYSGIHGTEKNKAFINGVCEAFLKCNDYSKTIRQDMFHQRDFVYFLRYLRKHAYRFNRRDISPELMLKALQRNFNGLPSDSFKALTDMFFATVKSKMAFPGHTFELPSGTSAGANVIQSLQESLRDQLDTQENANTASFRYIMLLDPTLSNASLSLLFEPRLNLLKPDEAIICSVGGFCDDSKEQNKTAIVLRVKNALAVGQTVIMTNSEAIHANFYDIFNRHFTILTEEDHHNKLNIPSVEPVSHRSQYYANIAVGSYSRPCPIHPNAKLIIHVPESKLPLTPLPMMNRFEKYRLTVEQALEYLIPLRLWWTPSSLLTRHTEADREENIIQIIETGARDMITQLHIKSQNCRLLYGISSKETLASFMFHVVSKSIEVSSNEPEISPAFHVPFIYNEHEENLDQINSDASETLHQTQEVVSSSSDPEEDIYLTGFTVYSGEEEPHAEETSKSDKNGVPLSKTTGVANKLRNYIKSANLHLLQLARPEIVFLCRELPKAYVQHYLLCQEHLSVLRFLRRLINVKFSPTHESKAHLYSSKWAVFTRTSGPIASLHLDAMLHQYIIADLYGNVDPSEKVASFALSAITSSGDCTALIEQFFKDQHQHLLLCVADMRFCSYGQINHARFCVNNLTTAHDQKCVVFVLHFPPENVLSSTFCYDVVYLNGWDFIYIDALGAYSPNASLNVHSRVMDNEETIANNGVAPLIESTKIDDGGITMLNRPKIEIDARSWLAKAYGLNIQIPLKTLSSGLKEQFFLMLKQSFYRSIGQNRYATHRFYKATTDRERASILVHFFETHEFLYKHSIETYANSWKSHILNSLVTQTCQQITHGQLSDGLLQCIHSGLRVLIHRFIFQLIPILCANNNLETLDNLSATDRHNREFACKVISTIKVPTVTELVNTITTQQEYASVTFTCLLPPPKVLFFDYVIGNLSRLIERGKTSSQGVKSFRDTYSYRLLWTTKALNLIKQDDKLMTVVDFLDKHSSLLESFKEDFIHRRLALTDLKGSMLKLAVTVFDALCQSDAGYNEDLRNSPVMRWVVLPQFRTKELTFFALWKNAFLLLKPSVTDDEISTVLNSIALNADHLEHSLAKLTVRLLWNRFESFLQQNIQTQSTDYFISWCKAVAELKNCSLTWMVQKSVLNRRECMQITVMVIIYFFTSHIQLVISSENIISQMQANPNISKHIGTLTDLVDENGAVEIESWASFLAILNKNFPLPDSNEYIRLILFDTFEFLLMVDQCSDDAVKQGKTMSNSTARDIESLLKLCYSSLNKVKDPNVEIEPCEHLSMLDWSKFWYSFVIFRKPEAWRRLFFDFSCSLINGDEHFCYNPRILVTTDPTESTKLFEDMIFHLLLKFVYEDVWENTSKLDALFRKLDECHQKSQNAASVAIRVRQSIEQAVLNVLILYAAAERISVSYMEPVSEITHWPLNIQTLVINILKGDVSNHPMEPQKVFFQSLKSEAAFMNLMTSEDATKTLELYPTWYVDNRLKIPNLCTFSFTLDPSIDRSAGDTALFEVELQKHFFTVRRAINTGDSTAVLQTIRELLASCSNEDTTVSMRNRIRMFLIIICYYDYFENCKSCDSVCSLLQNAGPGGLIELLQIGTTSLEIRAFEFIANGPLKEVDYLKEPLAYAFSEQAYQNNNNYDKQFAHVMVNLLAVIVGLLPETCYLYSLVFNPKGLIGSKAPGSDYGRDYRDCGYRMEDGINLTTNENPPIMNNNRWYRLSLASMVWMSFSWACLIDAGQGPNNIKSSVSMSYVSDGQLVGKNSLRDTNQITKAFVYHRASAFFGAMRNKPDETIPNVDAGHFLSEAILRLWIECDGRGRPLGAKPVVCKKRFESKEEAVVYENFLMTSVFDAVVREYSAKKAFHQALALQIDQRLDNIIHLRNTMGTVFTILPLSYNLFNDQRTKTTETESEFLHEFLVKFDKLCSLQELPVLVEFYRSINEVLAYQFTIEETRQLSVPQCIHRLQVVDNNSSQALYELFEKFKTSWNKVRDALEELEGCRQMMTERRFEGQILLVDDNTLIGEMITESKNPESGNAIVRVVSKLVELHNSVIQKSVFCRSADNVLFGDISSHVYISDLSCEALNLTPVLLVPPGVSTSDYKNNLDRLIFAHLTATPASDNNALLLQRSTISFNIRRLEQSIISRLINGRQELKMDNFEQVFRFIASDSAGVKVANNPESTPGDPDSMSTAAQKADSDALWKQVTARQYGIGLLEKLAGHLLVQGVYDLETLTDSETRLIANGMKGTSEHDLLDLADILVCVLRFLRITENVERNVGDNPASDWTKFVLLSKVVTSWMESNTRLQCFVSVSCLKISKLKSICRQVVEDFRGKKYLFKEISDSYSVPLPSEVTDQLLKMVLNTNDDVTMANCLSDLANQISDKRFRAFVEYEHGSSTSISLREILASSNRFTGVNHISLRLLDLPNFEIQLKHLSSFLRTIYILSGRLAERQRSSQLDAIWKQLTRRSRPNASSDQINVYVELVPEFYEEFQNEMEDAKPVAIPSMSDDEANNDNGVGNCNDQLYAGQMKLVEWQMRHERGLKNTSSNCYINAAVQVISHIKPLAYDIVANAQNKTQLIQTLAEVLLELWSPDSDDGVDISPFREALSRAFRYQYQMGRQHDAVELLRDLIQQLLNAGCKAVQQLFSGSVAAKLCDCTGQQNLVQTECPYVIELSCARYAGVFLQQLIIQALVNSACGVRCDHCNMERISRLQLPNVLITEIHRHNSHSNYSVRSAEESSFGRLELNEELDLSAVVASVDQQSSQFALLGSINHLGYDNCGHFTVLVRDWNALTSSTKNTQWKLFDDNAITITQHRLQAESYMSEHAVCLIWVKKSFLNDQSERSDVRMEVELHDEDSLTNNSDDSSSSNETSSSEDDDDSAMELTLSVSIRIFNCAGVEVEEELWEGSANLSIDEVINELATTVGIGLDEYVAFAVTSAYDPCQLVNNGCRLNVSTTDVALYPPTITLEVKTIGADCEYADWEPIDIPANSTIGLLWESPDIVKMLGFQPLDIMDENEFQIRKDDSFIATTFASFRVVYRKPVLPKILCQFAENIFPVNCSLDKHTFSDLKHAVQQYAQQNREKLPSWNSNASVELIVGTPEKDKWLPPFTDQLPMNWFYNSSDNLTILLQQTNIFNISRGSTARQYETKFDQLLPATIYNQSRKAVLQLTVPMWHSSTKKEVICDATNIYLQATTETYSVKVEKEKGRQTLLSRTLYNKSCKDWATAVALHIYHN